MKNETIFDILKHCDVSYLERQTCLDTTPYAVQLASQQWNSIFFSFIMVYDHSRFYAL